MQIKRFFEVQLSVSKRLAYRIHAQRRACDCVGPVLFPDHFSLDVSQLQSLVKIERTGSFGYLAPSSRFFQRRLWPLHFRQYVAAFAFLAPQSRHTV